MKPRRLTLFAKIILAVSILILLFLLFELLFRGQVISHALASSAYNSGKYKQAGETWNRLRDPADGDPIPENSLGKTQFRSGKFGESDKSQAEALKENNQVAQFHYDRGNALYRGGKLDDALKAYRSAMLLDPDDQDAKSNYELVLKRKGYKPPPPEEQPEQKEDSEQGDPKERQTEPEPPSEDDQEQFRNQLDALDQQEARDRQQQTQPGQKGSGKWW